MYKVHRKTEHFSRARYFFRADYYVSNEFITSLMPYVDYEGLIRPRPTASKSMGAHVSVFHEAESVVSEELGLSFAKG